ncbi:MAG: histidine--tRNA ligase [Actinomycetota bacterium]
MNEPAPRRQAFQAPPGTRDVLPPESDRWMRLLGVVHGHMRRAGFGLVHGPVFEDAGVFQRLGEGTDVVTKEMYDFHDRGDRHIALRPESTASVARSFVQHRPSTPWKVWYAAAHFRYERAQAGRYRQHHQFGAEVFGSNDPDVDVEVMALAWSVLRDLGLERILLVVNSMGDPATRVAYSDALQEWLRDRHDELDPTDQAKIDTHPLRVLDSKKESTQAAMSGAPLIDEFLTAEAVEHFERVQQGLGALGIPFALDPRLVRGLDYYTHTTFEIQSSAMQAAQSAIAGGGRYDGLVEDLGGPKTPGVGFGSGIERVLLAADAERSFVPPPPTVDVFVVDATDGTVARDLSHELRRAGLSADRAFDQRSMRSQMKSADRSGATVAVIVGEQELTDGVVTVRDLRGERGQRTVPRDRVVEELLAVLADGPGEDGPDQRRYDWLGGEE